MSVQRAKAALHHMRVHIALNSEQDLRVASRWAMVYLAESEATKIGYALEAEKDEENEEPT